MKNHEKINQVKGDIDTFNYRITQTKFLIKKLLILEADPDIAELEGEAFPENCYVIQKLRRLICKEEEEVKRMNELKEENEKLLTKLEEEK